MKILMLGTLTSSLNGSSRSFVRLANYLSKNHKVLVVFPDKTGVVNSLDENVDVTLKNILPLRRSVKAIFMAIISVFSFYKLIKTSEPDVVHINDIPWFYLIPICRFMRVPVITHSRFFEPNRFVAAIVKNFLKSSNKVIFVSQHNRNLWKLTSNNQITLQNPGIFDFNIHKIPLAVERYALIVSRISFDKGILESIRLFSKLKRFDTNLKLLIAGDSQYPYQKRYKELCHGEVKKLGLIEDVLWLGHIEYPHYLYKNATFFIHLPNFDDPFPTTIMEALALNCKIISNNRGGIPEQVQGFTGCLLIDNKTSDETICKFLNQDLLIDRAEEYHQKFDDQYFYKTFSDVLISVAKKK